MSNNGNGWLKALAAVAPTLARVIGGPLAGTAVDALSKALFGHGDATQDAIGAAIAKADPDTLLKLKQAELEFQAKMADLGVELDRLDASDRDSARRRQVDMKDWTPNALALGIVVLYATVQWFVLTHKLPQGSETVVVRGLGILEGMMVMVFTFYFGSSRSSRDKDAILGRIAEQP